MSLFDFAYNMGKKLFQDDDDDKADKIKKHIEEENPGVKDLNVEYEDGKVKITGNADDAASLEKAVLMAGNVEGVGAVDADGVDAPKAEADVEFYEIKSGDTLWKIAEQHLGSGSKYMEIFEANKEVIKNPDLIYPGQKIRIPK